MPRDRIILSAATQAGTGNAEKRIAPRPSPEEAQAIFDHLLKQVEFANEHVNDGYMRALGLTPPKQQER